MSKIIKKKNNKGHFCNSFCLAVYLFSLLFGRCDKLKLIFMYPICHYNLGFIFISVHYYVFQAGLFIDKGVKTTNASAADPREYLCLDNSAR